MEMLYIQIAVGTVLVLLILGAAYVVYRQREEVNKAVAAATRVRDDGAGHEAPLEALEPNSSLWGLIKQWRHRAKAKKMAKKGYVKWYKVDSDFGSPTWVKPELRGTGTPEYYDNDEDVTYFFPKDAMLRDTTTGAWVAVHHKGQAEPVPVRDPAMPSLDADKTQQVIQLEAESDPRGFFDKMNLDAQTLMWVGIFVMIVLGGISQIMGGA